MAEEEGEEAPVEKAGSGKKMIMLGLVGLLVLGGGGGAAWYFMGGDQAEEADKHAKKNDHADDEAKEPGPVMVLEPFLLNLADHDDVRFLKVSIKLELDRPEEETDYEKKVPAIRDALLVLLSSKESQLLRTVNGKRRVREEITKRVNRVLSKGEIANVFFTDFIIQ